jgi:predicted nucleotidyltransferase
MKPREIPQSVRLALEELKAALVELYGERLEGVYLYGSYARGDFTEDSDIDVLVVLHGDVKPGAEITRLSPLLSEICLRHGLLLSVFPVSAEDHKTRQSPFMVTVRREEVRI